MGVSQCKGISWTKDFFVAKNCHFIIKKEVPSNMIKGTFWKIFKNIVTFQGGS
jgi:hypothetical protein